MAFEIQNGVLKDYEEEAGVTEVVIPNAVTKIGIGAFSECRRLTSVTIPDSVTEIREWAFDSCTRLTSVTIPNSVKKIGDWAFSECVRLRSVTIPHGITRIGEGAFYECEKLSSVTIPDSVTEIGAEAFLGCKKLTSVIIPDSVIKIGQGAFQGCRRVIWNGVTLMDDPDGKVSLKRLLSMVQEKNYAMKISRPAKYQVMWLQFCEEQEEEVLLAYIKKHFVEMFLFAIEQNNIEAVEAVCKLGKLLTAQNIDELLEYAIEKQKTEIQLMLLQYKNEKIGYQTGGTLKL